MMKDVIRDIASGNLPLIGIIAFLTAFILILVRVALMSKKEISHVERLPLQDDLDILRPSDPALQNNGSE